MQILQTIPANTVALEGAAWTGSQFLTTRGDGQPIHPFTSVRTKQGTAQWPQFAPPRVGNLAKLKGARRSINTGDAELWLECEVAGTTAASAPVINYSQIGQTVVDGTVTWRVKGLHAFKGFSNWPARTNLLIESTIPSSLTNWSGGGFTYSAANAFLTGTAPLKSTQDNTGVFRYRMQTVGTFTTAQSDTVYMIIENVDALVSSISLYDFTVSSHVARVDFTWATETAALLGGALGSSIVVHSRKLANVGPNGGKLFLIGVSAIAPNVGNSRRMLVYTTGVGQNALSAIVHHAQFEANTTFPSPPIVTTTSTVTRAATNLSLPTAGNIRSNDFGVDMWVIPGGSGQTTQPFATYTDANNETSIAFAAGTVSARKRLAGVNNDATATYTHAAATPVRVQVYFSSGSGVGVRVRQTGGNWTAWATNANVTAASIATALQVGGANNGNHFAGNYPATRFVLHSDPKAELERLAAIDDLWVTGGI